MKLNPLILVSISLSLLLTACTITLRVYKPDEAIRQEAFDIAAQMDWRKTDGQPLEIVVFSAKSRRILGDLLVPFDFLVPLRNSKKDARKLRNLLLTLKRHPDYILIYFTENPRFDYRVISRALDGLQLEDVKFFLAARPNKRKQFESLIKSSGADFVFIQNFEKPDKYIEWNFLQCYREETKNSVKCREALDREKTMHDMLHRDMLYRNRKGI